MNLDETKFPARDRMNDRMMRQVRYTGPASYVTGGDPVNATTELGMAEVYTVHGTIGSGSAIRLIYLDYVNQKIQWFIPNTGAEVANGVDLSGFTGTLTFYGKG